MPSDAWVTGTGGLALFLLAMLLMTEGLTAFAGGGLKRLLGRWTSTPLRGVLAGIAVTGLVQSSSAVTVATIGFVNAGLLTLRQALGVIFGANVGTTMTGWLVSLVGFGLTIEAFALPVLTLGVLVRLAAPELRLRGLGQALAGCGLFFLGLSFLREAFGGLADAYGAAGVRSEGIAGFIGLGFVVTVLTQSSSAAIAIILTAATGGVLAFDAAAAAVIGANLGTTSTAAVAVVRATPAAKRLAIGHITFNALTGIVALALLPGLLAGVTHLGDALEFEGSPAALLALFHTVFNVMGVALVLPLTERLAARLERLFTTPEEALARPRHLDATLAATPVLAAAALRREVARLGDAAAALVHDALGARTDPAALEREVEGVRGLGQAITAFVDSLLTGPLPQQVAGDVADALYATRYFVEVAGRAPTLRLLRGRATRLEATDPGPAIAELLDIIPAVVARPPAVPAADTEERAALRAAYQAAKGAVLAAAVERRLPIGEADRLFDLLASARRLARQYQKGQRLIHERVSAA